MAAVGNWQAAIEDLWQHCRETKTFKDLKCETDRVLFVHQMKYIGKIPWLQFYFQSTDKLHLKSEEKSILHRNHGTTMFKLKKYDDALLCYIQSIMEAPENSPDLGLAYGNCSAAMFYLEHYKECEEVVKLALDHGYPQSTSYKLYLRWAQCLYRTGNMDQATKKLSVTKDAVLQNSDMEEKRKVEILKEIKCLETEILKNKNIETVDEIDKGIPQLFQGRHTILTQATSAVDLLYTEEKGRYIQAKSSISAGSTIIVEKPFASVLLPDHYLTHCHHCVGHLSKVVPCRRCTKVLYCSDTCRNESWSIYHKTECQYLDICHSVGIAHLSLRIILVAGRKYLLNFREQLCTNPFYQNKIRIGGVTEEGTYDKNYLSVYDLMTHSDDIDIADLFQYSMTALLLLIILKKSGWLNAELTDDSLNTADCLTDIQFSEDDLYIGGLLLRHIEQLVCNAHAITELQITQTADSSLVDSKSQERVATAIYPTTSLLNHSCVPSIIAGFDKDLLVVRVIKDVEAGEEIFNCYGPHHKRMSKADRQQTLKSQYFFTCQCLPCQTEEEQDIFTSFCCPLCKEALKLKDDKCTCMSCDYSCESAKFIKDEKMAHQSFINGLECLQQQDVTGAISKFKYCLDKQVKILYKHNKNLAETQDCLARCYAISEQYDKAVPFLRDSVNTLRLLYGDTSIEYANELHKFAGILYHAKEVREGLTVIDNAVKIFMLHFGYEYDLVQELEAMKLYMLELIKL